MVDVVYEDGDVEKSKSPSRIRIATTSTSGRLGTSFIGRHVSMLWAGDVPATWFRGTIKDYSPVTQEHLVRYNDGDNKWHSLSAEEAVGRIRWES